jgi:hypothetical protein
MILANSTAKPQDLLRFLRLFPLCFLRCLLFGSQRLTEANQGNEEEIPAPKNFVLRLPSTLPWNENCAGQNRDLALSFQE